MSDSPRAGEAASRLVHAQETAGSTPAPATSDDDGTCKHGKPEADCWMCTEPNADQIAAATKEGRERMPYLVRDEAFLAGGNKQELGPVAGIIKTPGIDDALDAIESEADVVATNRELLEGTPLGRAELERWRMLYQATLEQCNKRLKPRGVVLAACAPNPNGLGAVFIGVDRDKRDYTVTLTLPARERVDFERASKEDFVRWAIDTVCSAVIEQREIYLRRAGLSERGAS